MTALREPANAAESRSADIRVTRRLRPVGLPPAGRILLPDAGNRPPHSPRRLPGRSAGQEMSDFGWQPSHVTAEPIPFPLPMWHRAQS